MVRVSVSSLVVDQLNRRMAVLVVSRDKLEGLQRMIEGRTRCGLLARGYDRLANRLHRGCSCRSVLVNLLTGQ